jgi:hypothetical protein
VTRSLNSAMAPLVIMASTVNRRPASVVRETRTLLSAVGTEGFGARRPGNWKRGTVIIMGHSQTAGRVNGKHKPQPIPGAQSSTLHEICLAAQLRVAVGASV